MIREAQPIPLYAGELIIIKGECAEICQEYDLPDMHGSSAFAFHSPLENGYSRFGIAFIDSFTPGVIAHEALHATHFIFKDRHIDCDLENDEPQAYLLEWIVNECHKFLQDV